MGRDRLIIILCCVVKIATEIYVKHDGTIYPKEESSAQK
jgi:hypothetical protein